MSMSPRVRALLPAVLGVLLILGAALVLPRFLGDRSAERAVERAGLEDDVPADLGDVQAYDVGNADHTEDPVDYEQAPPVGGPHHPVWWECGVFDDQLPDENVVHSLEHGTVWVTYDPDAGLTDEQVQAMAEELPDKFIVSPYAGQAAPVMVTVWARQLELDGPDDPRLALFVAEYGDGHTSPEAFASCAGGTMEKP